MTSLVILRRSNTVFVSSADVHAVMLETWRFVLVLSKANPMAAMGVWA